MVCALHQSTASSSSSSSSYSPAAVASTTRQNISSRKHSSSSSSSKPGVLVLLSQFQRFPLLLVFWTVCLFNNNSYSYNNNNINLVVDAFLVLSRHKTTMSTDAIRDAGSGKVLTSGVIFRDEHAEITAAGQADTQCITSIGDIRGFDRNVHESPQYCVHVRNYYDNNDNDESTSSSEYENFAVVAGVAGKQPALYRMPYKGAYDEAPLMEPFYLPTDTFPVDIKTDSSDGSVYVGLHDTFGTLVGEWNKPLEDVLNYFESVTVPNKARVISPKVMKADMMASIRSDENNDNTNNAVVWQTELTTTSGQSLIGGMAHVPSKNVVVVAGSSDGTGPMVGGDGDSNSNDNDDSWDGYVTVLDADTGNERGSVRIQSDNQQDDFIHGVCALGDEIFIVGSTNGGIFADNEDGGGGGDGDGGAFVMKLNVDTLEIVWTKQFVGIGVTAIECQVTVSSLFVAGHVPAGVLMEQDDSRTTSATTTTTTQDLMVLAMDPSTSEVFWVRQIDSRRDDRLSNIMVAINGDLYIMANALDFADESNDVYLLTVTRQGGIHDWLGLPEDADPIDGHRSSGTTTIDDVEEDGIDPEDDKTDKTKIIIIAVAVPVFLLLLVVIYGVATSAKGDPNQRTADDTGAVEKGVYKHSTMTAEPSTADVNFT